MEDDRKKMIWADCPACAYKHLTAAYAILSGLSEADCASLCTVGRTSAPVLMARAAIALGEYLDGYEGNLDLAVGCLAAVNMFGHHSLRDLRLSLSSGACEPRDMMLGMAELANGCRPAAFVDAHVTEAIRELAELGDPPEYNGLKGVYLDWLREKIAWVKETYELRGRDEATA